MRSTEASLHSEAGHTAIGRLNALGQSCWLDDLSRGMMEKGELKRFILQGVRGVTANPATMAKAISPGTEYNSDIRRAAAAGANATEIYERLITADVRQACDIFRDVYDETRGADGFVSLEVSPYLADDADGSIVEAKRLWEAVDRPNLFIKIPGTTAGTSAIEELLFEGININITLLFSIEHYEAVAEAYLKALERRVAAGKRVEAVASVASFFLSRIDVLIDAGLEHNNDPRADSVRGKVAIANAKVAYQCMRRILGTPRWATLRAKGARPQRLLWASTSTKNPNYLDLMYVEPLVGQMTINTMPEQTIAALLDHGRIKAKTIEENVDEALGVLATLNKLEINFVDATDRLEREGVRKFVEAFDHSIEHVKTAMQAGDR